MLFDYVMLHHAFALGIIYKL